MMAAYLVGRRDGGRRTAMTVAGTVTVTHTAGVLLLGLLATATTALAPRSAFPLLATASGLLVAAVGAVLVRGQVRLRHPAHDHAHDHGHDHHHEHPHPHGATVAPGRGGLIGMSIAGGLVPSPSALVVLLGAMALGRAAYGVALVVAFGVGLASTLTLVGMLAARAGDRLAAASQHRMLRWPNRVLPVAGAATVLTVGLALTARGLAASLAVL
jgi:ABC-type nickel/cobalt efflux system permease component RcnA